MNSLPDHCKSGRVLSCACTIIALLAGGSARADADDGGPQRAVRTFFVTRSLTHDRLIPYLKAARPQVVQIGNYGAMFHGYADDERSTGWPMQLPVSGERAALEYQRKLNERVHELGLTVVGHFRLIKVMGDWEEQSGFVEYYNDRWPKDLLGPKPHPQLIELLQRDADGRPIQLSRSSRPQLALCLSSPHARRMFRQMLKVAVDHGVDGVMTNFNYRYDCACPYCQDAFKTWLRRRFKPEECRAKLGIDDLEKHVFRSIPGRIPGYPDPEESGELDWLAVRWGADHFKQMFDRVFLDYGRSLKKDLLVGQWNHLGHVGISEERTFVPLEMWGRGEDYFWYSGGAAFVGKNLNLSEGKAGDAWLSCLYVREMSGGKPFVIGKYDRVRMAASMAEGFATGGMGMGRYMKFEDPVGFEVLARYTNFRHEQRDLYDLAAPWADAALVLPRQSVLNRRPEAMTVFRDLGQALVERRVLIDVVVDQTMTSERLARYPAVILPNAVALSDEQLATLRAYAADGGLVLVRGTLAAMNERGQRRQETGIERAVTIAGETTDAAADAITARLRENGGSSIDTRWTVRATAYTGPGRIVLHLVNYNREEGAPETNRTGPATERPQPVEDIAVSLRLPRAHRTTAVSLHAPGLDQPVQLRFENRDGRVAFTVPRLDVYGVIAVDIRSR